MSRIHIQQQLNPPTADMLVLHTLPATPPHAATLLVPYQEGKLVPQHSILEVALLHLLL